MGGDGAEPGGTGRNYGGLQRTWGGKGGETGRAVRAGRGNGGSALHWENGEGGLMGCIGRKLEGVGPQ